MKGSRRAPHLFGLLAAWLLLTAARQSAAPLPDMLLPIDPPQPIGKAFTVRPGDVVLRGAVVKAMTIRIEAPVTASLDRFSHDFKIGDMLTPVLLQPAKNGAIKMIFCGPDQRAISKFTALMIGELGSKFERVVRFCFQDEDVDGKFEGFVLAGAKDPAFQSVIAIAPVAYTQKDLVPYPAGADLTIVYRKFVPESQKLIFDLKMTIDGQPYPFDYVRSTVRGLTAIDYPTFKTNPKKVPYPSHFGNVVGSDIGVRSVDPATGQAEMVINANFSPTLIKPVNIQTQTIYIYIYR